MMLEGNWSGLSMVEHPMLGEERGARDIAAASQQTVAQGPHFLSGEPWVHEGGGLGAWTWAHQ
jgi:hypothetical protein